MILETIEILDSNLTLTLEQLQTKVTNGDYNDLLNKYNLLMIISGGLVLINKDDKSCKIIAPTDLDNYVKFNDYATADKAGVLQIVGNSTGIAMSSTKLYPYIVCATTPEIDSRDNWSKPIVPRNLDYAVRSVYPITKTDLTETITVNTIYNLGLQTSIDITLPSGKIGDFIQFDFVSGTTKTTLSIVSNNGMIGYDDDFSPEINKVYSLYFDWGIIGSDTTGAHIQYGWRCNYSEYSITLTSSDSGGAN